jgi:hypothetical protein
MTTSRFSAWARWGQFPSAAGGPAGAPPSTTNIVAAEIEDNGWVLALTLDGVSAGGFADYTLDPDGSTPALRVITTHPGYVQSGGEAVSGNITRVIPATIPLRLPVNLASPTVNVIDEEDIGGGQRKVRITLANHVYATDTLTTLSCSAGWRTGEEGATGILVTNNSTLVAPVPIFRWMRLTQQVETGTFRLSLFVASHHPVGFQPVAGVKFTATDGTTVKTVWATALGTDNDYGDNLRCYTVTIDPAAATALTEGQLRCDAEVYPWLGSMRSTDPAGTKAMGALPVDARGAGAQVPFVVAYDPDGDVYNNRWVVVDAVNGTTTASAAMVATTLAGAKAVAPASKPQNINCALQALYLQNITLPAMNGASSVTRAADGARIVLPSGVSGWQGTNVTSGLQSTVPVRIIGDPDDADPRVNCILRSGSSGVDSRANRFVLRDLKLECGQAAMTLAILIQLDNCDLSAKAGFESSISLITGTTPTVGTFSCQAVKTRWWKHVTGMDNAQHKFNLIRACEFSRAARSAAIVTSKSIQVDDDTVTAAVAQAGNFSVATAVAGCEDNIFAFNDFRRLRTRALVFATPSAADAGTSYASVRRLVILGNVFELFDAAGTQPFFSLGEGVAMSIHYNIIENNTFMGERVNGWYADPPSSSSSIVPDLFCNRQANNAFDRNATKHDNFLDGTYGYRPHLIGGWSAQNGVMHEGNWDGGRAASDIMQFRYWFRGLRSVQTTSVTAPGVTDDRSEFGADTGGGDYRPASGSPLLDRMQNSNTDRDFNNAARSAGSPAGAFEAA